MIATTNLAKEYGARVLFADVSLQLNAGSRYGLVGANGSGKTTFLKILAGDEEASAGTVTIAKRARVGVLRQDRFLDDDAMILDLAMRGDAVVSRALEEQRRLTATHGEVDAGRLADLEDVVAAHDGYTLEARASEVLDGLAIPTAFHRAALSTLSGGFKLRVLLAQVLVGGVDVLLLDEPTNHLDILTIRWLEKFLAGYAGCAVIISHDQRFLDNVTSHTLDVDYGTITLFTGPYSKAVVEKGAARARAETSVARAEAEIDRKRAWVERFGAKNTKATQAQSRLKQIEKIEVAELADSSRRTPLFKVVPERPSGREVLELAGVSKSYGEKRVLTDLSLLVRRGERVAIIGPNGLGKSTLLRIIVERLQADTGQREVGARGAGRLLPAGSPRGPRRSGDDAAGGAGGALPGGEPDVRARAAGARAVLGPGRRQAHRAALRRRGGAAHLRAAGGAEAQRAGARRADQPPRPGGDPRAGRGGEGLHRDGGVRLPRPVVRERARDARRGDYAGGSARFSWDLRRSTWPSSATITWTATRWRCARGQSARERKADAATDGARSRTTGESWADQKKRRNRAAQLPKLRDKLLAAISSAEARKAEIQAIYADPDFFQRASRDEIDALMKEQESLGPKIDGLVGEWEAIEREMEVVEQPR